MTDWVPIGATYNIGSWMVLWGRQTEAGEWEFAVGHVGLNHCKDGTPGGVAADD